MLKAFYKSTIYKSKLSIMFHTNFSKTQLFPWYFKYYILNTISITQHQIGFAIH